MEEKPKPKSRKKSEEPTHQIWGRQERLLVFFIFSITITIPIILMFLNNDINLNINLPQIQIKTAHSLPQSSPANEDEFVSNFRQKTSKLTGVYGFYLYNFTNNTSKGLFENERFPVSPFMDNLILATYRKPTNQTSSREVQDTLKNLNMLNTFLDTNVTTPVDISKLILFLRENNLLSQKVIYKSELDSNSFINITDSQILIIMSKNSQSQEAAKLFADYRNN